MSPGPTDPVNAKELSARAAVVERSVGEAQLERVREAGGLPGTRIDAELRFGSFEGRPIIDVRIMGVAMMACQRCLGPCRCDVDESTTLMVVRDEDEDVPGGYEPFVATPEHLSLTALIEEQVLLAMPLVPMHEEGSPQCRPTADAVPVRPRSGGVRAAEAVADERQTPFANLRELLDKKSERDPRQGE